jgi:hypothetical protein
MTACRFPFFLCRAWSIVQRCCFERHVMGDCDGGFEDSRDVAVSAYGGSSGPSVCFTTRHVGWPSLWQSVHRLSTPSEVLHGVFSSVGREPSTCISSATTSEICMLQSMSTNVLDFATTLGNTHICGVPQHSMRPTGCCRRDLQPDS